MKKLICALALLGCASGCTQMIEHAAYVAPEHAPPPPTITSLQFGETIEADAPQTVSVPTRAMGNFEVPLARFYKFSATPGQTVTITMRSKGGDTHIELLDSFGHSNVERLAYTTSWRPDERSRAARARGDHSELIIQLPEDEDGVYYISPFTTQGAYSLTLQAGSVPAQDILKKP